MIWYRITRKPRPRYVIIQEIFAISFALLIGAPLVWMASDRTGPWVRLSGRVEPPVVKRGERIIAIYEATPLIRYCPGKVQREVIDSQRNMWPKLMASTVATWDPIPDKTKIGTVVTPGVVIPNAATPGPAVYRVTTFWYCNSLQRWLDWPVVQVGPDLQFEIIP